MFWAAISGDLSIVKFKGIPIDTYLYECPLVRRHENVMRVRMIDTSPIFWQHIIHEHL